MLHQVDRRPARRLRTDAARVVLRHPMDAGGLSSTRPPACASQCGGPRHGAGPQGKVAGSFSAARDGSVAWLSDQPDAPYDILGAAGSRRLRPAADPHESAPSATASCRRRSSPGSFSTVAASRPLPAREQGAPRRFVMAMAAVGSRACFTRRNHSAFTWPRTDSRCSRIHAVARLRRGVQRAEPRRHRRRRSRDLQAAWTVAAGVVDAHRLAMSGLSYGGYLTPCR